MTRASFRFRGRTLTPDEEPDVEPLTYAFQCAVCEESGPADKEPDAAMGWVFRHLRDRPERLTYRSLVILPYRIVPGAWR
ncbi:DUF7848 domain-containing protein [Streptomyces acidicola]|uniref:DUF7848 domain-containing protein n=1 Tax=Streptomyces acidicola TaxID=2596892 RepID=A0A5N8X1I6_9ACTN|nr:hypothetical protein [Streptomyces acidicola]